MSAAAEFFLLGSDAADIQWGLFSFHRIGRKWSHLKEEPKIMGNPGGQLFSCHSSGEMSLGKCKFSMGDVIRELKSSAKNGHIS